MNSQIILRFAISLAIIMASALGNHDVAAISSCTLQHYRDEARLKGIASKDDGTGFFRLENATLGISFPKVEKLQGQVSAKTSGQIG